MSKIKHTPLPWKIRKDGITGNLISIGDKHKNWICEFFFALVEDESKYGHPIITKAEALENARLFLAAPELYAALKKIAEMEPEEHEEDLGTSGTHTYTTDCHTCNEMIAIAREALEKAEAGK